MHHVIDEYKDDNDQLGKMSQLLRRNSKTCMTEVGKREKE